jgi:type IV pilus assembly protein PilY1
VINRNSLIALLAATLGVGAPFAANAQSSISEDFTGTGTSNQWYFFNGACLTAGTLTGIEPAIGTNGAPSGGRLPGCTTIAKSYYNKSTNEVLVGGYNGTFPDPPATTNPTASFGALRFTNGYPYGYSENGGVIFATPFPTGQGVAITFKTVTYRGNSGGAGGDGADGISFYLMDASKLTTSTITGVSSGDGNGLGSWGGSLGYTCSNANTPYNGLVGAYLGLGIDEYGNFLNGKQLMSGYTGSNSATGDNTALGYGYKPNRIGLRGAGNIAWTWLNANYPTYYPASLSGSAQNAAVAATCAAGAVVDATNTSYPVVVTTTTTGTGKNKVTTTTPTYPLADYAPIPGAYVELPSSTQIANESATTRGQATPIFYQLKISQNGLLSLSYSLCPPTGCGAFISVIKSQNITTSNGALPQNFLFGFAGSTGGSSNIHEILCFKADPATSAASSAGASEKQSAKLETGVQAYFAYYNPSNGWTGRVTASSLEFDSYGNIIIAPTPNWDASCYLTGGTCSTTGVTGMAAQVPSTRQMLTWSGSAGIPFEYGNLTTTQQQAIDLGDVATASCNATTLYATADRVNYLRGARTCEVSTTGVGEFRRRSSVLADIMDSSPVWVGAPNAPYSAVWNDRLNSSDALPENSAGQSSYAAFATAQQNRQQVVYVGANDGLVHGFRSGTFNASSGACSSNPIASCFTNNDGKELLAYMPGAVVPMIHSSTNANVDFSNVQYGHNFFVDATPGTGDLFYNSSWHSWLVGGLGAGGSAIYAIDITNPGNFSETNASSLVMGEWTSASITCTNVTSCGKNLGNTYGTPQIRRLHDGRWALIFGNGFGSTSGDAGIFIGVLNPTTAVPTFYYLSTGTGGTTNPNGIAFTTAADLDGDHMTDYIYAGDLQGNLWRFDLTSATESSWAVTPGPMFKTPAGQPITTAPVIASGAPSTGLQQQLMILFGTGQKQPLTNASAATFATGTQSLYGVWDWNLTAWNSISSAHYAATTLASTGLSGNGTLSASNLQAQTVSVNATTQDREIASNATICWASQSSCTGSAAKFGWTLNLPGTQEQVIYNPALVAQALTVNSIVPAANSPISCTNFTDTGFTYVISAMTGGAFNQVFLPPSEVAAGLGTNPAYADQKAIGMQTDATGSSFITSNSAGTSFLIYETNQVEAGNGGNNIQGGALGLNLPPNTIGHRVSWVERR